LGLTTDGGMGWLLACTALYLATTRRSRHVLAAPGTWLAIALAALAAWPRIHAFLPDGMPDITERLSALGRSLVHIDPDQTLLVIALQFLLFGPVLLVVLVRAVLVRHTILPHDPADRLLLFHSVPIFVAVLAL